jgi:hypothetical protein
MGVVRVEASTLRDMARSSIRYQYGLRHAPI